MDDVDAERQALEDQVTRTFYSDHFATVSDASFLLGSAMGLIVKYAAERDRLLATVESWQDSAGEVVERYQEVLVERDRLRAALVMIRDRPDNQADLYATVALDPSQIAPLREVGIFLPSALDASEDATGG